MGRAPCCAKVGLQRGPWTPDEDSLLVDYIQAHGEGQWRSLPKKAGLLRCGKSCRLRWMNYLRPDIIRGNISPEEEDLILRLHALLGNKWSLIAGRLPGRTDNEIKNYWNTHLSKKLRGINPAKRKKSKKNTQNARNVEKQKILLPKPVRVTSLSLTRNDSLASLESNVSNSTTSNSSGGEAPSSQQNNMTMTMTMMMDENTGEEEVMDLGLQEPPLASDLDKLYQEYFQLLLADDDFDSNEAQELNSFADSLLM